MRLQPVCVLCVESHAACDAEETTDSTSLHNRPLWLYSWNSITLTQTDGLAVSGDARHLLASGRHVSPGGTDGAAAVWLETKEGRDRTRGREEKWRSRFKRSWFTVLLSFKRMVRYLLSVPEQDDKSSLMFVVLNSTQLESGRGEFSIRNGGNGQTARRCSKGKSTNLIYLCMWSQRFSK